MKNESDCEKCEKCVNLILETMDVNGIEPKIASYCLQAVFALICFQRMTEKEYVGLMNDYKNTMKKNWRKENGESK